MNDKTKTLVIAAAALAIVVVPAFLTGVGSLTASFNFIIVTPAYAQGATHCSGSFASDGGFAPWECSTVGPNPSTTEGQCSDGCSSKTTPTTHQEAGQHTGEIQQECHTTSKLCAPQDVPFPDGLVCFAGSFCG